jgi:ADP-heptose:LPS heptosyltransferase
MARSAERTLLSAPVRTVLVQRVDQLGDLVASVPAIRRLRTLLPHARMIGLLSAANADLGRTLGLFDEIVLADFPEDPDEGRRVMTLEAQQALRRTLARHRIDLAIDLSESGASRPLLLLSGAPFRFGFRMPEAPWLSADVAGATRDPVNGLESAAHAAKLVAMVEWLGATLGRHAEPVRRPDLDRRALAPLRLDPTDRFVVLHGGARLAFSRWPHFHALAAMLLERTDRKVVMLADDLEERASLSAELAQSERFLLIDEKLPFDSFDALMSFCDAFVGNDTGPKHLASLRGAKVVSLHVARHNWSEWGQDQGVVMSRRVPCAGCGIHYEPEECGRDFACIRLISAEEVFAAVERLL